MPDPEVRWWSLGSGTKWCRDKLRWVQSWLAKEQKDLGPLFWVLFLVLDDILEDFNNCFKVLQNPRSTIEHQQRGFEGLVDALGARIECQLNMVDAPFNPDLPFEYMERHNKWEAKTSTVYQYMCCNNLVISDLLEGYQQPPYDGVMWNPALYDTISQGAHFLMDAMERVESIHVIRDTNNQGCPYTDAPPCLPLSLLGLSPAKFSNYVRLYRKKLLTVYDDDFIDRIVEEARLLRRELQSSPDLRDRLEVADNREYVTIADSEGNKTQKINYDFDTAWAPLDVARYPAFCAFADGLGSTFPGSSRVEFEFSIINSIKTEYMSQISNFALEGIIYAKQFLELLAGLEAARRAPHSISDLSRMSEAEVDVLMEREWSEVDVSDDADVIADEGVGEAVGSALPSPSDGPVAASPESEDEVWDFS
ncbi:hypothetical protein KIPB_007619 [Kipferlia bialata]|uniref:Uncharacterized protein n=1 Tax=Kipferlia bialata TaxID=797122 RepID=A0A391NN76_9EUKA|nr:hypothetical protein KIPB_003884 [Kipferlia bialata]GCA63061.1 hypothetical protein KIPB_007619 [Kipferlia bialata]|eukprot:g3884.t1